METVKTGQLIKDTDVFQLALKWTRGRLIWRVEAIHNGRRIGSLNVNGTTEGGYDVLSIDSVGVDKPYQNKGIGTAMFKLMFSFFPQHRIYTLYCLPEGKFNIVWDWYTKLGFKRWTKNGLSDSDSVQMVRWPTITIQDGPIFDNGDGVYRGWEIPDQLIDRCLPLLDPQQRPFAVVSAYKAYFAVLSDLRSDEEDDRNEVIEAVEAAMIAEIDRLDLPSWFGLHPEYPDCWGIWPLEQPESEDENA